MIDPGTGLTVLGGSIISKELIEKILGPTAEYLGDGIKDFAEKRKRNIENIFLSASKKLGNKINSENGSVPPKVLRDILNDGSFSDDKISMEYFGGVLASSRTGISRDDRGAYFTSIISRMSSYQLRLHYIFYKILIIAFKNQEINFGLAEQRIKLQMYIPGQTYEEAMDFTELESKEIALILIHSISGLAKESLIENNFHLGPPEHLQRLFKGSDTEGIIFQPTLLGAELFLWAVGRGDIPIHEFLNVKEDLELDNKINIKNNFKKVVE